MENRKQWYQMSMQEIILEGLKRIEQEFDVKVIFAAEAGSRAWGFESPDSDYDVRFVYVRPVDTYLSVFNHRNVIDAQDLHSLASSIASPFDHKLLDFSGWDISKALHLAYKSNPQLLEWINGPITYVEDKDGVLAKAANELWQMQPTYEHYRAMAKSNYREYLQTSMVKYKKYLYVIRPLLAARYVVEQQKIPPVSFAELRREVRVPTAVHEAIDRLLELKMATNETDLLPRVQVLNDWIANETEQPRQLLASRSFDEDYVDRMFRDILYSYAEERGNEELDAFLAP